MLMESDDESDENGDLDTEEELISEGLDPDLDHVSFMDLALP